MTIYTIRRQFLLSIIDRARGEKNANVLHQARLELAALRSCRVLVA